MFSVVKFYSPIPRDPKTERARCISCKDLNLISRSILIPRCWIWAQKSPHTEPQPTALTTHRLAGPVLLEKPFGLLEHCLGTLSPQRDKEIMRQKVTRVNSFVGSLTSLKTCYFSVFNSIIPRISDSKNRSSLSLPRQQDRCLSAKQTMETCDIEVMSLLLIYFQEWAIIFLKSPQDIWSHLTGEKSEALSGTMEQCSNLFAMPFSAFRETKNGNIGGQSPETSVFGTIKYTNLFLMNKS